MTFLLLAALGVLMALIYLPLRIYLTLTARGRRLRLLQRIRLLRQQLGEELTSRSQVSSSAITIPPSTWSTWPVM